MMKNVLTAAYLVSMVLVLLILGAQLFGTFMNWPMYLGGYSALLESHYSVPIFVAYVLLLLLAFLVKRRHRTRLSRFVFVGLLILFFAQGAVIARLYQCAWSNSLSISFTKALRSNFGEKSPHETFPYLTLNGNEYLLDVYRPADSSQRSIPVVQVHGGGFVGGSRTMAPHHRWFTERRLTVFDVDYPLGTDSIQTWETAANAVATAMSFVRANSAKFNLDTTQLILCGGSAGGGLALQVGYGLGLGQVKSFSTPAPKIPTAIIAIYPPVDLTSMWKAEPGTIDLTANAKRYIGGSPTEFPERYARLDIANSVRSGLPKTLIITGTYDHVVPIKGIRNLVQRLHTLKQPVDYLEVPFGEHYFDGNAHSLSGQIKWQAMDKFLRQNGISD